MSAFTEGDDREKKYDTRNGAFEFEVRTSWRKQGESADTPVEADVEAFEKE